ncbi:hypothetical protein ART_3621 [Arthrobacter sp. PAMC 25486]|nr:hypothetical protein ART_3621 [Arthrobacter sp. PAMC 25486]
MQGFASGFLPTPPHGDAVAIGEKLNHLLLQRTFTSKQMPMLGVQDRKIPGNLEIFLS